MADTVASHIGKTKLDLPTSMASGSALGSLWTAEIDTTPPDVIATPPPSMLPSGADANSASWILSKPVELAPGVEARVYFLET